MSYRRDSGMGGIGCWGTNALGGSGAGNATNLPDTGSYWTTNLDININARRSSLYYGATNKPQVDGVAVYTLIKV